MVFPSNKNLQAAAMKRALSSGCIFCDLKMEPVKLRRRWVHHIPKRGQLVPCEARNLKPQSAA